jgi:hypothetical protein
MTHRWIALAAVATLAVCACSAGGDPSTAPRSASPPGLTTPVPSSSGSQRPSVAPLASVAPFASRATSPVPLGRDQAIAIARRLGVATNGIAQAEAGPFRQFEPAPNRKISPPPPYQWVWRVRFVGPVSTSFVILDYYTGKFVEAGIATP